MPEGIRPWGSLIRGGYGAGKFFVIFVFLLSARESAEVKGENHGRERTCVVIDRRIEGGLCCFIYTPVFTVSYGVSEGVASGMGKSSLSKFVLWRSKFCVALFLAFRFVLLW